MECGHSLLSVPSSPGICSDLPSLTNGMISYSDGSPDNRQVGTLAIHSCNLGYTLNGESLFRICKSEGEWSGSDYIVCQRKWNGLWTIILMSLPISLQVSALTYPH